MTKKEVSLAVEEANLKSIRLLGDFVFITEEPSGVFCDGVQYYDFKYVQFINSTGMANLINLLKSLLESGKEVQFVNVNETIKNRIKSMGLEHIFNCG